VIEANSDGEITSETVETSTYIHQRLPDSEPELFEATPQEIEPAAAEPRESVEEAEPPAEPKSKPRAKRASRGSGRGRGKKKPAVEVSETPESADAAPAVAAHPHPAVVVRTGSTDKHLIEDEPAFPQPVRRPKSVRDLDHIPDDFD
jgi:hypothetical protein